MSESEANAKDTDYSSLCFLYFRIATCKKIESESEMESEHDQKNTNSQDGQSNVASLVTMYRYPFRVEEMEETWAELPDLLLEEIYILLANRWRSYCSQVCIISFQKNFGLCDVEGDFIFCRGNARMKSDDTCLIQNKARKPKTFCTVST